MHVTTHEFEWRGRRVAVQMRRNGGSVGEIVMGDLRARVEVIARNDGVMWLNVDGRATCVRVHRDGDRLWISANGRTEMLEAVRPQRVCSAATTTTGAPRGASPASHAPPRNGGDGGGNGGDAGRGDGGRTHVTAPTTGLVARLLVAEGEAVEAGQELALLESMKMLFRIRAPRAGRVGALHAVPGGLLRRGETLACID